MNNKGLESFTVGAMNIISNKIDQACSESLHRLTFKQWFLLIMMSKMGNTPKTVQDVADFCGTSRQNTRRMLASLEKQGLCKLEPSAFDGRALTVKLTRQGVKTTAENEAYVSETMSSFFDTLDTHELELLVQILQKLLANLESTQNQTQNTN